MIIFLSKRRVQAAMATVEEARSSRKISNGRAGDGGAEDGAAQEGAPRTTGANGKRACSDYTVVGAHGRVRAWGHNEDYSKVFATTNYLVQPNTAHWRIE